MKKLTPVTTLFLDIGGVLLTNGRDDGERRRAARHFKLELAEMNNRHYLTYDTYEEGKLTLEEYLDRSIFYKKRPFTKKSISAFHVRAIQARFKNDPIDCSA
jgi:putative hydrolase of the HAD superfamily